MNKKIKVFLLSDNILAPSGVGSQARLASDALLHSGKFQVRNFGGAIKHPSYHPIKTEEYGEDLIIYPVDNFGTKESVRSFIRHERPDIMMLVTDPRFFFWLFEMENEIRPHMPIVYWNLWDAAPAPMYNQPWYRSVDELACISKLSYDLVSQVVPEKMEQISYLPHTVNTNTFKLLPEADVKKFRLSTVPRSEGKMVFFYNGRNARRKHTGSLLFWFKEFLDKVGHDKAILLMHTEVHDENGPDLEEIVKHLGLINGQVFFSQEKVPQEALALMYNMVDCTLSISDAEGFGIPTLESLACGTPIIVTRTGGLQEQVIDGVNGFAIEPKCKMLAGSQQIPYIEEDRILKEDFIETLLKFYNLSPQERKEMGLKGIEHVKTNYGFEDFGKKWVDFMEKTYEKYGSWETRKNYKSWSSRKI